MPLTTPTDVVAMLRWGTAEQAKYETQLPFYISAAEQIVERLAGPFEARTVEHVADGGHSIALPYRVNEVVAVEVASGSGYEWVDGYYVPGGGWLPVDEWTLNATAGIVYGPFPSGQQNIKVTFTTGYDEIPDAVTWATTSLVVHMWAIASQRGPGLPEDYTAVPTGFLVPNVVKEALAPYKTMPGFA